MSEGGAQGALEKDNIHDYLVRVRSSSYFYYYTTLLHTAGLPTVTMLHAYP